MYRLSHFPVFIVIYLYQTVLCGQTIDVHRFAADLKGQEDEIFYEDVNIDITLLYDFYPELKKKDFSHKNMLFIRCDVDYFQLNDIEINSIIFYESILKLIRINIKADELEIGNSLIGQFWVDASTIDYCNIYGINPISNFQPGDSDRSFDFRDSNINSLIFEGNIDEIYMKKSHIDWLEFNNSELKRVTLIESVFESGLQMQINSNVLVLEKNEFASIVDFSGTQIHQNADFHQNSFKDYVDIHTASFPADKYIPYVQLEKGLIANRYHGANDQFGEKVNHDKLVKGYESLILSYDLIGDNESKRAAVIDLLQHQKSWARFIYKTEKGLQNFFLIKGMQMKIWHLQDPFRSISLLVLLGITAGIGLVLLHRRTKSLPDHSEKRLAAIVFSDMVGYTLLMGKDEKKALQTLDLVRSIHVTMVHRYHGKLLKELGDGFLCSFSTASDAVNFCIDIQREISQQNFKLRMGVHLGEVTFSRDDVHGDGVNIASRLQAAANEGCICISGTVYQNIRNHPEIKVEFIGEKELKHVTTKVAMYGVNY